MAMRTVDLVLSVRHTFKTSRLRVALTLLGIMIGAGAMVLLSGLLVAGEEALLRLAQNANESDMIEIQRADAPRKDRNKTTRDLSKFDAAALQGSELLRGAQVNAGARKRVLAYNGAKEKWTSVFAAEADSRSLYRIEVEQGRWFTDDDFKQNRRVAVVGHEMWTELLGKKTVEAGLRVRVDDAVFEVIGVLKHKPTMGKGNGTWMWDRRTLIPSPTYHAMIGPSKEVQGIFVRMKGASSLTAKAKQLTGVVEQTLLRRHYGVKNFEVQSEANGEDQEKLILRIIEIMLFGTGVVALFVGGINIMNIMLVTVTERTREIGLRRAIGATPGEISRQFLLEAATLAGAGGVLGIVGGIAATWLASVVLTNVLGEWRFVVEPWALALALGMAVGTGVVFGLFPALRAAKLDPVVALRME